MEKLTEMIENLHLKFEAQTNELKETRKSITSDIKSYLDEKLVSFESRLTKLEKTTEQQGHKIEQLERAMRKRNVVFFGVEETERSYFDLQSKIVSLINDHMNIDCRKEEIQEVRRVGKNSGKIRPIIVTLNTMGKKIELLKNKNSLSTTSYYIKQDFPPEVIEERKKLQNQLKIEKEKGNRAFIKYNKLVILPNSNQQNERQKRNLSLSPEIQAGQQNTIRPSFKKPTKKNKTEITQYVIRCSQNNTQPNDATRKTQEKP